MGRILPTKPLGEGFVQAKKIVSMNSSLVAEIVISNDEESPDFCGRCAAQERVLRQMGWTKENYFEIVRLLIIRRDVDVEGLSISERAAYFEIYDGLAA